MIGDDDIEDWDDFEEVDLSKKFYVSDETRDIMRNERKERNKKSLNNRFDMFLSKVNEVHGDRYDYSKVEYVKMHDKVIIICSYHGEFTQTPHAHTRQKQGCPICAKSIPPPNKGKIMSKELRNKVSSATIVGMRGTHIARVMELHQEGISGIQIARKVGIAKSTVWRIIRRNSK